ESVLASLEAGDVPISPELRRRLQTVQPVLQASRPLTPGGTWALDVPPIPPAIIGSGADVFWSAGEYALLTGPEGVGKTTAACQIVLARLGVIPRVLGLPVEPTSSRVVWLAADRAPQIRRR